MTALFVIANDYRAAAEKLADMDLDAQTIADTLEGLSGELEVKAQNVAMFCKNLEATAEAINAHTKTQQQRAKAIWNRAESLRAYLQRCMEATGIQKIEGPSVCISFRQSSAVVIDGVDLIPAAFLRQPEPPPPSPDKTAIAEALKSGESIPGAHIEQRQHIQIK